MVGCVCSIKDARGCSFTPGWGLLMLLQKVSARTRWSGEEQSHAGGDSHTRLRVSASCVPLALLPGTEIEHACVLVGPQPRDT